MKDRKTETCVYEGLGFPVKLINVPMKKVFGEWVLDIDLNKLQLAVLYRLLHKPTMLKGGEIRFIRKFLNMSTTNFGKLFGVSHVAVVKWESGKTHANPSMEVCIRLHMLNYLQAKDREFRNLYNTIGPAKLAKSKREKIPLIVIDIAEDLKSA